MKARKLTKPVLTLILAGELARLTANATDFEPIGSAVATVLGTKKAFTKSFAFEKKPLKVFYAKGKDGKATRYAFEQKGIYPPNCTHTWIVGVDAKSNKVTEVRVVEMSCPHAFPTKTEGYLGSFKGKGVADAEKLKDEITPISKATGTSDLTVAAVRSSLLAASKLKGKL